jgi:hypothetical protein
MANSEGCCMCIEGISGHEQGNVRMEGYQWTREENEHVDDSSGRSSAWKGSNGHSEKNCVWNGPVDTMKKERGPRAKQARCEKRHDAGARMLRVLS